LPFLRVKKDANTVLAFKEIRRKFDFWRGVGKLMLFEKGIDVLLWCRGKLLLM
jgi:hypothetical protein